MQSLRRTRPRDLDDLAVQVAIIRPGPIQGGAVNPYIERRKRLREDPDYEIPYEHPSLEPVLRDTLGTIIFQDQVMEVAQAIAGYTPGEAEGLRRAMSRKRSQELLAAPSRALRRGRHATRRRRRADGRARLADGRGFRGLRLSQGAQRRLRPARLPVDLAARALRPGVPLRAAQRAADGLLRAGQPRARGRAQGHLDSATRREQLAGRVHRAGRRRAPRPRLHQGRWRRGGARAGGGARARRALRHPRRAGRAHRRAPPHARTAGLVRGVRSDHRRRAPGGPGARAPARSARRTGARRCGSSGSPRRGAARGRGPSWRCRWRCRRLRACARSGAGSG